MLNRVSVSSDMRTYDDGPYQNKSTNVECQEQQATERCFPEITTPTTSKIANRSPKFHEGSDDGHPCCRNDERLPEFLAIPQDHVPLFQPNDATKKRRMLHPSCHLQAQRQRPTSHHFPTGSNVTLPEDFDVIQENKFGSQRHYEFCPIPFSSQGYSHPSVYSTIKPRQRYVLGIQDEDENDYTRYVSPPSFTIEGGLHNYHLNTHNTNRRSLMLPSL